jgi:hypothetical protein
VHFARFFRIESVLAAASAVSMGEMEGQLALPHLSDAKGEHPEVIQRLIMQHEPLRNATATPTLNL